MITLSLTPVDTPNKRRWDALIDNVRFELYIPKWRIPTPPPEAIHVTVQATSGESNLPRLTQADADADASLLLRPIHAVVRRFKDHTQTVRFTPVGNKDEWEIGEPYIPYSLIPEDSKEVVQITVVWV